MTHPDPAKRTLLGKDQRYNAPWERTFWDILHPLDSLIRHQTTSGVFLLSATALALVAANSGFAPAYGAFINTPISLTVGGWVFEEPLRLWVNDGLMAIFFYSIGLEIKREMQSGALASFDRAALPFIAAIGGMIGPALIYLSLNPTAPQAHGWGIPVATDIAFVIGALSLLGSRAPKSMYVFLVTLAIADDLLSVLVIALFYSDDINVGYLGAAGLFTLLLLAANLSGGRRASLYGLLALCLWFVMLKSGIHATLAGVIAAFLTPARSKTHPALFSEKMRHLMDRYDASHNDGGTPREDDAQFPLVQALQRGADHMGTPLHFFLERLRAPVAFFVLPVFAFVNAGVTLDDTLWNAMSGDRVWLGVFLGLVFGKCVGIFTTSMLAVRLGIGALPEGLDPARLAGAAMLGGIGFTMAMFISTLAFRDYPLHHLTANIGILMASVTAGIVGYSYLSILHRIRSRRVGD
ncbi:MAG: Na+/H+ antiporter NhaA [Nitrospinae bacterium]|nr:Na+/H+ antiporter NhaA [Nitrospinota bacterium]